MERIGAAEFSILTWDESTISEIATGRKITQAKISASYQGDMEGKSVTETLMTYSPSGDAAFMGIEHFTLGRSLARRVLVSFTISGAIAMVLLAAFGILSIQPEPKD